MFLCRMPMRAERPTRRTAWMLTRRLNHRSGTANNTGYAWQLWRPAAAPAARQIGVESVAKRKARYGANRTPGCWASS